MSTRPAGEGGYSPDSTWMDFSRLLRHCTDSAAASTAMSAGVKTHNGVLGLDAKGRRVDHLLDRREDRGMATGLVTSVQFAHATPAGFCVHFFGVVEGEDPLYGAHLDNTAQRCPEPCVPLGSRLRLPDLGLLLTDRAT
jgi:hypothetical protein